MNTRSRASTSCRAPKEMLVARRSTGVGPGVKIEVKREVRNDAMSARPFMG